MNVKDLEPQSMWTYFDEITQIPRPSKKEEKIRQYLVDFGKAQNLETHVDEIGNVIIRKAASKGMENHKMVCLQSHMDMVCEKNMDTEFDFENDPIQTQIIDGWVRAKGTTLGADDGIGIAASLAILAADDIQHGPIEALFTMDEETGLTGAFGLEKNALKSDILLNLDSEDEGELFIGCAGGRDTIIKMNYSRVKPSKETQAIRINVGGLHGGHSGDDIHKGFANANKLLIRIIRKFSEKHLLELHNFHGGNLRNAIAREAYADICILQKDLKTFEALVAEFQGFFAQEYHKTEPQLNVSIEQIELPTYVITKEDTYKFIHSISACPHGVLAMSQDIDNFVETSTNLASIRFKEAFILITTSQRSSVSSALNHACAMIASNFALTDSIIEHTDGYPGWAPNPNSEIVEITRKAYEDLFKKTPKVLAIHAGLECGLIGEKFPAMDMISFGPTIKGAHSPDEGIEIKTAIMFWDLLLEVLKRTPKA